MQIMTSGAHMHSMNQIKYLDRLFGKYIFSMYLFRCIKHVSKLNIDRNSLIIILEGYASYSIILNQLRVIQIIF